MLYTNVVEPVLRWTFVQRGYALVHGACVVSGDRAYLITARTDTGKTTTMLKLLDRYPLGFMSDDLTLVNRAGLVLTYPKPLTISNHTLHAVERSTLNRRQRVTLPLQSRVHSRSGRRFAFLLTKTHLPVATINALIQLVIPPPKYHVERLVPDSAPALRGTLGGLVVIERGGTGSELLEHGEALEILFANCEDAYGFPPYAAIEPFLRRGPDGNDLRDDERAIVSAAFAGLRSYRLKSETMDWAERIPALIGDRTAPIDVDLAEIESAGTFGPVRVEDAV